MNDHLRSLAQSNVDWLSSQFQLMPSHPSASGDIFTFANYLAALALWSVVMVSAEFRFRYRLSIAKKDRLLSRVHDQLRAVFDVGGPFGRNTLHDAVVQFVVKLNDFKTEAHTDISLKY